MTLPPIFPNENYTPHLSYTSNLITDELLEEMFQHVTRQTLRGLYLSSRMLDLLVKSGFTTQTTLTTLINTLHQSKEDNPDPTPQEKQPSLVGRVVYLMTLDQWVLECISRKSINNVLAYSGTRFYTNMLHRLNPRFLGFDAPYNPYTVAMGGVDTTYVHVSFEHTSDLDPSPDHTTHTSPVVADGAIVLDEKFDSDNTITSQELSQLVSDISQAASDQIDSNFFLKNHTKTKGLRVYHIISDSGKFMTQQENGFTLFANEAGLFTSGDCFRICFPNGIKGERSGLTYVLDHKITRESWEAQGHK